MSENQLNVGFVLCVADSSSAGEKKKKKTISVNKPEGLFWKRRRDQRALG